MQRHKAQVQDLMTPNPFVVEPATALYDAYTMMFEKERANHAMPKEKQL